MPRRLPAGGSGHRFSESGSTDHLESSTARAADRRPPPPPWGQAGVASPAVYWEVLPPASYSAVWLLLSAVGRGGRLELRRPRDAGPRRVCRRSQRMGRVGGPSSAAARRRRGHCRSTSCQAGLDVILRSAAVMAAAPGKQPGRPGRPHSCWRQQPADDRSAVHAGGLGRRAPPRKPSACQTHAAGPRTGPRRDEASAPLRSGGAGASLPRQAPHRRSRRSSRPWFPSPDSAPAGQPE
jgi:hypothetical protein